MIFDGFINERLEPIINNFFLVSEKQKIEVNAILDTGFNGSCCLPRNFFDEIPLQPFGNTKYELANGQIIYEKTFITEILLNNIPYFVEITFTDSNIALLGMEFIQDKIATFNLKDLVFRVDD